MDMLTFYRQERMRSDGILNLVTGPFERSQPKHSMPDERYLIKRMRRFDPEAITQTHNRYFPDVFRYARYRLGDPAQAEDIASETFVRLLDALHSGKGPHSSLRGWLMGTASNLINDHFRQHYAQPIEPLTQPVEIKATDGNPATHVEQTDHYRILREALKTLPHAQQHVLALRFGSGCSLAETAEIMKKKPNAIKQLQFRALTALRNQLGGELDV